MKPNLKGIVWRIGQAAAEMKRGESRILLQTRLTESSPEELELEKSEPKSFHYGCRRLVNTDFYILDVHTGDVETLPRIVQDRDSELCSMAAAALRSRVYVFGGQIRGDTTDYAATSSVPPKSPGGKTTTKLFYFLDLDPNHDDQAGGGWKRAGPPLTAKQQLHLDAGVAFGGNMYFFRDSPFSCLCELFDPKSHQWRRIKSLPGAGRLYISPPVLADDKNERIIVRINDSMYAYYPSRDEWEFVVKGFKGWYSRLHPVTIVDGVIYIHHPKFPGFFRAFDIATKQYLNVQLSSSSSIDNYYDESSLLHLHSYGNLLHLGDGILCLLGQTYQIHEPDQSETTSLHIVQFKVELIKNNNNDTMEVLVTPTSSKYHHLTSRCHLVNCLLI